MTDETMADSLNDDQAQVALDEAIIKTLRNQIAELESENEALTKRYLSGQKSLAEAAQRTEKFAEINRHLEAEKIQWFQEKMLQNQVIQQEMNRSNALNNEQALEINRLRDRLRNLSGWDKNGG